MATDKDKVEEIRNSIEVITSPKKDDDGNVIVEAKEEVKEEIKEPEKEEEKEVVEAKEGETEEIEEAEVEDVAALKRTIEKLQKRVGKTTAEKVAIKKELEATQAKLNAKPDGEKVLTEADVETLAEQKATNRQLLREFNDACNKIFDDGVKASGLKKDDFKTKIDAMTDDIGGIPNDLIYVLTDLDNSGAVLNHLADDTELAEEIYKMPPTRMAVELTKISNKLASKPKKPIKEVSKVPDPVNALGGKAKASTEINLNAPGMSTEEWIAKRNRDITEKRANGKYNLR